MLDRLHCVSFFSCAIHICHLGVSDLTEEIHVRHLITTSLYVNSRFPCDQCDYIAFRKRNIEEHKNVHTGIVLVDGNSHRKRESFTGSW